MSKVIENEKEIKELLGKTMTEIQELGAVGTVAFIIDDAGEIHSGFNGVVTVMDLALMYIKALEHYGTQNKELVPGVKVEDHATAFAKWILKELKH